MTRLIALFAVALVGCVDKTPPPYDVRFADDVPQVDRNTVHSAMGDWDRVTGSDVLVDGPRSGECGHVLIVRKAHGVDTAITYEGACNQRIEYSPDYADKCSLSHELGHALGLDDDSKPGSVMHGCGSRDQLTLTNEDGAHVRARWGL